jgi:hypothetical protein
MSKATEHERFGEIVSRGVDRGNFCNAYETEDYEKAIERLDVTEPRDMDGQRLPEPLRAAYRAAFTLGFFSSYELFEMGEHEEAYREAYGSDGGKACVAAGYIDAREEPEAPEEKDDAGDREWRREIAMQEGMAHGVEAYNDAMGWSTERDE